MASIFQRARDMVGDRFGAEILEQQIEKSLEVVQAQAADAAQPVSMFWDPMSMFMGREWLVKTAGTGAITFMDLRRMAANPIIASIIQTRLNQAAAFMVPATETQPQGFRITSDDPEAMKDVEKIQAITQWVAHCGIAQFGENNLETLARKCLRDSLVLDQMVAEVVPRRNGEPAYMIAVDGATVRRLKRSLEPWKPPATGDPWYAQIVQDRIVAEYDQQQLAYGVRNPQTDIRAHGYGLSELEFLFRVITTIINTERFNSSLLSQGGLRKSILVVNKPPSDIQFEAFKREFREAIRNASNFWRPPVLGLPEGAQVDWVNLDQSQRDMEYAQLLDFLVKEACGVYQIDPSEINWSIGASGTRTTFESRTGDKVQASQKKGLKPLLSHFAQWMTAYAIEPMDDRFRMEFVGVAEDRRKQAEVEAIEVKTTRTVNEIRRRRGDPPIPGGDIILSPEYLKGLTDMMSDDEADALVEASEEALEGEFGDELEDELEDPDSDDISDGVVDDDDDRGPSRSAPRSSERRVARERGTR